MPDLVTDLATVRQRAAQHHAEFELLRAMLERSARLDDARLDAFVDQVAAPIIAAIDCTECANCCRSLDVYLVEDDALRLSEGMTIPLGEIETRYISHDTADVGEWGKFRQQPCALLDDKRCSVYAHRPETCRTYPALTPDFRWTLEDTIGGAAICPIIYNTLVALCERLLRR